MKRWHQVGCYPSPWPYPSCRSESDWALTIAKQHHTERLEIARIFRETGRPPSEFFFVGRPGDNRVNGRLDLVYDDWLYPVFESIHLAEPRSMWLRRALTAGSVHFVVNNSDGQDVDGIGQSLPLLGYSRRFQIGPFFVWERVLPPASLTRGRDQAIPSELPLEQPGIERQRQ